MTRPRTPTSAAELRQVSKSFGDRLAVQDLSLDIPEGSLYGFIGPNGSGKTTTMRMLVNILQPDSGSIRVLGRRLRGSDADDVGYMPEERGLYKKMKVREILLFYGRLKGQAADLGRRVDDWLERFGLQDWGGKKVEALSKGMAQKVQFIATVVSRPRLLILDEPLAGLDPINAQAIKEAIGEIRAAGATVVFSTHDMSAAEEMCDFIVMIFQGRKVLDGTMKEIRAEYGRTTVRIRTDAPSRDLLQAEGVGEVVPLAKGFELILEQEADPGAVLSGVASRMPLTRAEIAEPTLHEIFLRIAGPGAGKTEALHA
jgi:ABC-2 type transport system ATP-binding protein